MQAIENATGVLISTTDARTASKLNKRISIKEALHGQEYYTQFKEGASTIVANIHGDLFEFTGIQYA